MEIYEKPDYGSAQQIAYSTIIDSKVSKLPISIKKIIKRYPNLHLQKYSVFAKKQNLSIDETIKLLDSEDGCLWMRDDNEFIILYNDLIDNNGRIRFTLAHELGHYILKHNEKSNKTILTRYSLTDEEYDIFEKEANYFAKRILAPIPLVDEYLNSWKKIHPHDIENIFQTSFSVASYIINDLKRRYRLTSIIKEGHDLVENFNKFLYTDLHTRSCNDCHSVLNKGYIFCHVCGSDNIIGIDYSTFYHNREKRLNSMIYSKINTNEKGYANICPRCQNEHLWNNQDCCQICGLYLQNKCIDEVWNGMTDNWGNKYNPLNLSGCQSFLQGDARFCPHCGGNTSYNYQSILPSWDSELGDKRELSGNVVPLPGQNQSM